MIDGLRNSTGNGLILLTNEPLSCASLFDPKTPRITDNSLFPEPDKVYEETLINSLSTCM